MNNFETLKDKFLSYWNNEDFLSITYHDAISYGFGIEDAKLLDVCGLPNWAAPNIMIELPPAIYGNYLVIGEDRDDRKIAYEKKTGHILIKMDNGENLFIAYGLRDFCVILIDYAYMVDKAIYVNGEKAYVENDIPEELISSFELKIINYFENKLLKTNFWMAEIARLRSHKKDFDQGAGSSISS